MYKAQVMVSLRPSILDPQGSAVAKSLNSLGFQVEQLLIGKYIDLTFAADSDEDAQSKLQAMCTKLLINRVTENYSVTQLLKVD